jgi:DHA1 family inner membrane transport protein
MLHRESFRFVNFRIYLVALGTFAIATDAFVIAGILPAIARSFHVTVGTAGQLVTIYALLYGFGAPLLAALLAPFSRQHVLIGALFGFSLANIASALAPSFGFLIGCRILAGVCAAVVSPTSYALAATLATDTTRGRALARIGFGSSTATVIGVPLGTWIGQVLGWPVTFGLIAVIAVLAAIILSLVGVPSISTPSTISLGARFSLMLHPLLVLALLPTLFWSMAHFTLYTYVAPFLQQTTHDANISTLLLIWGAGNVVGNWLGGYIVDLVGSGRAIAVSLLVLAVTLSLLPTTSTFLPGTIALLFLWGVAVWTTWPALQNRLHQRSPHLASQALALNGSIDILGNAAGAGVGGLIVSTLPVQALAWSGGAFAFVALFSFLLSQWCDQISKKA